MATLQIIVFVWAGTKNGAAAAAISVLGFVVNCGLFFALVLNQRLSNMSCCCRLDGLAGSNFGIQNCTLISRAEIAAISRLQSLNCQLFSQKDGSPAGAVANSCCCLMHALIHLFLVRFEAAAENPRSSSSQPTSHAWKAAAPASVLEVVAASPVLLLGSTILQPGSPADRKEGNR